MNNNHDFLRQFFKEHNVFQHNKKVMPSLPTEKNDTSQFISNKQINLNEFFKQPSTKEERGEREEKEREEKEREEREREIKAKEKRNEKIQKTEETIKTQETKQKKNITKSLAFHTSFTKFTQKYKIEEEKKEEKEEKEPKNNKIHERVEDAISFQDIINSPAKKISLENLVHSYTKGKNRLSRITQENQHEKEYLPDLWEHHPERYSDHDKNDNVKISFRKEDSSQKTKNTEKKLNTKIENIKTCLQNKRKKIHAALSRHYRAYKKYATNRKRVKNLENEKKALLKKQFNYLTEAKEWIKISGIIASVFVMGTLAIRAPGLISQYEALLMPELFLEQQKSVSNLLSKANNPFENIEALPVAGIKNNSEKIRSNEFLTITPPDTRIVIPKIAKNIPILEVDATNLETGKFNKFEADVQEKLKEGVVHYPGTANPGENGNLFITGHSSYYPWDNGRYKDVFAALHNLEEGDEYYVFHKGKKYKYVIETRKVVQPEDTSVLEQDYNKKTSTLMTCTPVGTAKNRLILQAKFIGIEY